MKKHAACLLLILTPAFAFAGCGDDSSTPEDPGQTRDASADRAAASDSGYHDAFVDATAGDATTDSASVDAGLDSMADAESSDAMADVGDGSSVLDASDAGIDAPPEADGGDAALPKPDAGDAAPAQPDASVPPTFVDVLGDGGGSVIDPTFGNGGTLVLSPGADAGTTGYILSLAVRPDTRVVALAGTAPVSANVPDRVLQVLGSGSMLDPAFGAGAGFISFHNGFTGNGVDGGQQVALQTDGKVLIAGDCILPPSDAGMNDSYRACVVRLEATGALDATYGTAGVAAIPVNGNDTFGIGLILDAQGRALVVGAAQDDALVARLTTDGALDTTFAGTGVRTIHLHTTSNGFDEGVAIGVQSTGRVVVLEQRDDFYGSAPSQIDFVVVGLATDGTLDPTFGDGNGVKVIDFGLHDYAVAMAVYADDSLLVAGASNIDQAVNLPDYERNDLTLAMLDPNGGLSGAFGQGGKVHIEATSGDWLSPRAIARLGDAMYVPVWVDQGSQGIPVILKVRRDGTLDPTFGANGVGHLPWVNGTYELTAASGAGEVVVGGQLRAPGGGVESFVIGRIMP